MRGYQRDVQHQDECFFIWFVYVGCFDQEEVGWLVNERQKVAIGGYLVDVSHIFFQRVELQCPGRKPVAVGCSNQSFRKRDCCAEFP